MLVVTDYTDECDGANNDDNKKVEEEEVEEVEEEEVKEEDGEVRSRIWI